jgi:hypothetical protein
MFPAEITETVERSYPSDEGSLLSYWDRDREAVKRMRWSGAYFLFHLVTGQETKCYDMVDVTGLVIIDGHADVRSQRTKLIPTMDDRVGLQGKLVARMGDRVGLQGILLQLDAGEVVTKVQGILLQPVAGARIHFCSLIQVQFHLEEHMLLYSSTSPINRLTIGGVVLSVDSTQVLLLMLILGIILYLGLSPQLVSVLTQRIEKQKHLIHFKKVIQLLKYIQLQIILCHCPFARRLSADCREYYIFFILPVIWVVLQGCCFSCNLE